MTRQQMPCLGVDPGSMNGAAVLLNSDGETVMTWLVWQKMARKGGGVYRGKQCNKHEEPPAPPHQMMHATLFKHVSLWCAPLPPGHQLVIEGLYIPARDGSQKIQEILTLAESVGEVRAAIVCQHGACAHVLRPLAREWRPIVAGIRARTPKAKAEEEAITKAKVYFKWEGGWPGVQLTKAERGALAEAAWIARYGVSMRLYDRKLRNFFAG